ncbi:SMP-30/gluconolactonase/LRE family protein [Pseudonocardia petroleophila]|uniref:SMP-30/gluconolactonase/LRE family protein n=1 Tax=Pseudonocardia petroleophila TaxID=37331 RepID=A0A7G7MN30_9PSEU|nr:SMP-30/gluconolactonase/LRE family protein [Pseudonocardia petroleophila]QNG54191.1 SMP-30/gluconolactonase/LRE family protein [Pseudonocardia petroleophila]
MSELIRPRVLLDGLAYVESPRWHDGRLWFAHWGAGEIVAVDPEGRAEVVAAGPDGLGWSFDFLPDGRMLVTGERLLRHEPDGTVVPHAEGVGGAEIVVDGAGNAYVNGFAFDFLGGDAPSPGWIDLVRPDGEVRRVAEGLRFPNGMVITPDGRTLLVAESFAGCITAYDVDADGGLSGRRTWADGLGPDGITLDAAGAVWAHAAKEPGATGGDVCVRVLDGEVTHRVPQEQFGFAAMLGGPDGRSLFLCDADWRGVEGVESALADRTGRILVADAPEPRAGWPGG